MNTNPEIDIYGHKQWFNEQGLLHRLDGPASERANGTKSWYQNGLRHRSDGSAVEYFYGGKEWWKNGQLHREDGPAIEYDNKSKLWIQNGQFHRLNGPAVELINGYREWWIEDKCYLEESKWKEDLEVYCLNKGIKSIFTIQKEAEEEKQKEQLRIIEFPKEYETIEL